MTVPCAQPLRIMRLPRRWPLIVALVAATVTSACAGSGTVSPATTSAAPSATAAAPGTTGSSTTASPSGATSSPDASATSTAGPNSAAGEASGTAAEATWEGELGSSAACAGLQAATVATVDGPTLTETSGVVASRAHPGVLWTHNDSGSEPALVAVDLDGTELAVFPITGLPTDPARDIEDIALHDGRLHLADTGDNNRQRETVAVHVVDEPDPAGFVGPLTAETVTIRYPERAWDVEAFAVEPQSGSFVFVAKRIVVGALNGHDGALTAAAAPVFVADAPATGDVTVRYAGAIPVDVLDAGRSAPEPTGPVGQLGIAGVPTGLDVTADGQHMALRTYATVWLFERTGAASITDALTGPSLAVCEAPTVPEAQGEAVGFLGPSGPEFVTVPEGRNPAINVTRQR
ncbi:MAG: hypothetical protein AAF467_11895 [Actinomycetota bacterium]